MRRGALPIDEIINLCRIWGSTKSRQTRRSATYQLQNCSKVASKLKVSRIIQEHYAYCANIAHPRWQFAGQKGQQAAWTLKSPAAIKLLPATLGFAESCKNLAASFMLSPWVAEDMLFQGDVYVSPITLGRASNKT